MKRVLILSLLAVGAYAQAQVNMTVYGQVGGATPFSGSTWTAVNSPFINSTNKVAFLGTTAGSIGGSAVYYNNSLVFTQGVAGTGTVGEAQIGISGTGGYIVSPTVSGFDAAYSNGVTLLKDGDPAPLAPGQNNSFNSRVLMTDGGTRVWVAGLANPPSTSSVARIFYVCDPTGVFTSPMRSGDAFDGGNVSQFGILFDYDVSQNGNNFVNVIQVGATPVSRLVKNFSTVIARAGEIAVGGEAWQSWADPRINNSGTIVTGGDTNGATTTDDFVAVGNTIVLKGSDSVTGFGPLSGLTVRSVGLNNTGRFVSVWGTGISPNSNTVMLQSSLSNPTSHTVVIKKGDLVDLNNDTVADFQVDEIRNFTGQALDVGDNDVVYFGVRLVTIGGVGTFFNAVVSMPLPTPTNNLTGTIDFGQLGGLPYNTGANLPTSLNISYRDAANNEIATGTATYDPITGAVSGIIPGAVNVPFRMSVKHGFWLRKTMPNPVDPATPLGNYNFGTIAPAVGDADDDNAVTPSDYGIWQVANGSFVTENTGADFDGDGAITPSDYGLWQVNNGAFGDD